MVTLAIETSCDETSVALIRDGLVLANEVSSQIQLHSEYGGVVPELATREHLRNLLPVARQALQAAGCTVKDVDLVAATRGPGLPQALMVGFQAAQTLAYVLGKPMAGIHHHEAHLYSCWLSGNPIRVDMEAFEPHVSLIVSGGHTLLLHVPAFAQLQVLGSTLDDAAGECFDKVAKLMGLPYPGGPEMDRLAVEGRADAHRFPRPMIDDPRDDFSFSGLKTSVRYYLRDHPEVMDDRSLVCDVCASVQAAIVEVLVVKTVRAALRLGVSCVTASGGVTANRSLRSELARKCELKGLKLRVTERVLCTDNAAMVGVLAEMKFQRNPPQDGTTDYLKEEVIPGWEL